MVRLLGPIRGRHVKCSHFSNHLVICYTFKPPFTMKPYNLHPLGVSQEGKNMPIQKDGCKHLEWLYYNHEKLKISHLKYSS